MSFTNTQTRGLPCAYAHNSIMQALTLPLTVLLLLVVFLLLCESLSLSPLSALQLLRGHVTSFLSTSHLLHLFLLLLLAIYCPPPSPAYLLLLSSLTFFYPFSLLRRTLHPPTNRPDPLSSSDSAFCRFLSSLHSSAFLLLASTHGRVAWWLEGDEYEEGGRVQGDEGEGV